MRLSGVVFQLFAMLGLFKSLCLPKADAMKLQPMMIVCVLAKKTHSLCSTNVSHMFDFR